MQALRPIRFINEKIEPWFDRPPVLEKKPGAPAGFIWRGEDFKIAEVIHEWHDYQRRGRMARNMATEHARRAERAGSWGVGRDYYQVRTTGGRYFEIYYDRAPKDIERRKGDWFLDRELEEDGGNDQA